MARESSPRDVQDEAWACVAAYVPLMTVNAPQRKHSWREVWNGWRGLVRAGAARRLRPHALPSWETVYHQGPLRAPGGGEGHGACFARGAAAGCGTAGRARGGPF